MRPDQDSALLSSHIWNTNQVQQQCIEAWVPQFNKENACSQQAYIKVCCYLSAGLSREGVSLSVWVWDLRELWRHYMWRAYSGSCIYISITCERMSISLKFWIGCAVVKTKLWCKDSAASRWPTEMMVHRLLKRSRGVRSLVRRGTVKICTWNLPICMCTWQRSSSIVNNCMIAPNKVSSNKKKSNTSNWSPQEFRQTKYASSNVAPRNPGHQNPIWTLHQVLGLLGC